LWFDDLDKKTKLALYQALAVAGGEEVMKRRGKRGFLHSGVDYEVYVKNRAEIGPLVIRLAQLRGLPQSSPEENIVIGREVNQVLEVAIGLLSLKGFAAANPAKAIAVLAGTLNKPVPVKLTPPVAEWLVASPPLVRLAHEGWRRRWALENNSSIYLRPMPAVSFAGNSTDWAALEKNLLSQMR
jgi:hypothetical protein